jgi:HK97 gp10 family phage protein
MTSAKQFINKLEKFMNGYKQAAVAPANDQVSSQIYQKSQVTCPVRTGHLKSTGYRNFDTNHFEVGYSADYAAAVNYGTFRMIARPFFTDAVSETTPTAQAIYSANLKKYWDSIQ